MKFSACFIAVLASSSNAFVVQNDKASSSALFSSIPNFSGSSASSGNMPMSTMSPMSSTSTGTRSTSAAGRAAGAFPSDRRGPDGRLSRGYNRRTRRAGRESRYENSMNLADNEVLVQGSSLKTWTYNSPAVERVQVAVRTEGRPFDAEVDLWQGPDNTPQKMRVYSEDGSLRPFQVLVETPRAPNTVAIRNVGQLEFPMVAAVQADTSNRMPMMDSELRTIQGGALRTYPFDPTVESVQVLITTDGRPLTARIELLQGPNNNKQVIEVYCEDGYDRPFYIILETPGSGNVVRVVNTATVEFPMSVAVEAYQIGNGLMEMEPVLGEGYGYNMNTVGQW